MVHFVYGYKTTAILVNGFSQCRVDCVLLESVSGFRLTRADWNWHTHDLWQDHKRPLILVIAIVLAKVLSKLLRESVMYRCEPQHVSASIAKLGNILPSTNTRHLTLFLHVCWMGIGLKFWSLYRMRCAPILKNVRIATTKVRDVAYRSKQLWYLRRRGLHVVLHSAEVVLLAKHPDDKSIYRSPGAE